MPKARRKKVPIVSQHFTAKSNTPETTRSLIRRFHVLLKQRSNVQKDSSITSLEKMQRLADVEKQISDLGGLESYQHIPGGGSEKILILWLKDLGLHSDRETKLRMLEVGALKPDNYATCSSWISTTPIDLHSRHPSIIEQDFLLMDEHEHCEKWGLISLSLVLNFVPDPQDRGRMLSLACSMLIPNGYLFLVLPLPCVSNSRYMTFEHLKELMSVLGFEQVRQKWRDGGKMVYWLYVKRSWKNASSKPYSTTKTVLRSGMRRNNFSIVLQ
ncbi:nucleolus protein [Cyathus striatus]|nr:nucleolus protein [Cyathus striatus]